MFWNIPPEAAAAYAAAMSHGQVAASGTTEVQDQAYRQWQGMMREYSEATFSDGLPKVHFWLVVGLPGANYANHLDWHHDIPMLMPASGTGKFLGVAPTKADVDKMIEDDPANVHLTFKVKIQGQTAWRDLIEFLARHDMLENEGN
jgi:hypothetical protein